MQELQPSFDPAAPGYGPWIIIVLTLIGLSGMAVAIALSM